KATASTLMNGTIIISIRMTRNAITPHEKSRPPMLCRTTPFAFDGDSVVSWVTGAWSFCTSCMLVGPPESRDLPDDRGHAERRDQDEDGDRAGEAELIPLDTHVVDVGHDHVDAALDDRVPHHEDLVEDAEQAKDIEHEDDFHRPGQQGHGDLVDLLEPARAVDPRRFVERRADARDRREIDDRGV